MLSLLSNLAMVLFLEVFAGAGGGSIQSISLECRKCHSSVSVLSVKGLTKRKAALVNR